MVVFHHADNYQSLPFRNWNIQRYVDVNHGSLILNLVTKTVWQGERGWLEVLTVEGDPWGK